MMKKIIPVILLLSVVMISGCVGFEGLFKGQFGGETITMSPDIVMFQNTNMYPTPPIEAGGSFTYSFEVFNQNNVTTVSKYILTLIDSGLCGLTSSSPSLTSNAYTGSLVPQQTDYFEWQFSTPTAQQIGNIPAKCPIKYKVIYDYFSKTQIDLSVISQAKLSQLQRAGEAPAFSPTQVIGEGPVKMTFEYGSPLPARTSSATQNSILPIFLTVEDKGIGLLDIAGAVTKGNIPKYSIKLFIPFDLAFSDPSALTTTNSAPCGKYFKAVSYVDQNRNTICIEQTGCTWADATGCAGTPTACALILTEPECIGDEGCAWASGACSGTPTVCTNFKTNTKTSVKYVNTEEIPIVKRASPQLRCAFNMPTDATVSDEKTYYIFAEMPYTYRLDQSLDVEVKPVLTQ